MLVFYSIGFPLLVAIILWRIKNKLSDPSVLQYFILLYQGVRHERYYWELVNMFRKFVLLSLHVFIPDERKILKSLFGSVILFITSVMQARLKPFKINAVSQLEHKEMLSSILTLYGGIIFVQDTERLQALSIIIFILIIIINLRFWIMWIFCALSVYRRFHYIDLTVIWLKKVIWIRINEVEYPIPVKRLKKILS